MLTKTFEEFIGDSASQDLHKVYLAINPNMDQFWWNHPDLACSKFFQRIHLDNAKELSIDKSFPVLNYDNEVTTKLLKAGIIDSNQVINLPDLVKNSDSKKAFHELLDGLACVPKTCFTPKEAKELKFPIIAKPKEGHSGVGIQVFKNLKQFELANHSKFDVYSEFIDKKSEHRIFAYRGKPISWMQRVPTNDKAKDGTGSAEEKVSFKYVLRNLQELPDHASDLISDLCVRFKEQPYICFDLMLDRKGKIWVIESNARAGVPFDVPVQLYKEIFMDVYKRPVNSACNRMLKQIAQGLIDTTIRMQPDRFEVKSR